MVLSLIHSYQKYKTTLHRYEEGYIYFNKKIKQEIRRVEYPCAWLCIPLFLRNSKVNATNLKKGKKEGAKKGDISYDSFFPS